MSLKSEKTINLEETTKNKKDYLAALLEKTNGMFLESHPVWTEVNNCAGDNVNGIPTENNKGPKM